MPLLFGLSGLVLDVLLEVADFLNKWLSVYGILPLSKLVILTGDAMYTHQPCVVDFSEWFGRGIGQRALGMCPIGGI